MLGAGGMGEVYRARDTKLERDVAIKVLPTSVAGDPERLSRFEREARLLASLNHPHIAAIYGLEESTNVVALVLELVEGETLQEKLHHGSGLMADGRQTEQPLAISPQPSRGLAVPTALAIARQIAAAHDAAHERGIVHRDLKPANIKITPEGTVKVLDFGLAKAADAGRGLASGPSDLTHSPTMMAATVQGVLLGTAPYMSPEQAHGRVVDKRADIWAFGCVLFEMLTGRIAFSGDTASDTIAAIPVRYRRRRRVPTGLRSRTCPTAAGMATCGWHKPTGLAFASSPWSGSRARRLARRHVHPRATRSSPGGRTGGRPSSGGPRPRAAA